MTQVSIDTNNAAKRDTVDTANLSEEIKTKLVKATTNEFRLTKLTY